MPVSLARRIAFDILLRVETAGSYADELLHAKLDDPKLKREDAALATELVMGTLRWQRLLDFLLDAQLRQKPKSAAGARSAKRTAVKLDPEVRIALRLGLYQLRWLERIPARAAVHESVELVKRARKTSAAPLVNAVLRRASTCPAEELVPPSLPSAERLAILHSHPTWLVERWLAGHGEEHTRALLEANNAPPRSVCVLAAGHETEAVTSELNAAGVQTAPGRWLCRAVEITAGLVARSEAFRSGRLRMQDEASQMVALLLDVRPGMHVLDLCAAPGGKTLTLAEAAGPDGRVVAGDLHLHRLRALRERLRGCAPVDVVALDAKAPLPFSGAFDAILVDVPCSGTGTLARNPEIRWRLAPGDLADLSTRQGSLLANAAVLLRPGGRLVYSTCALEPEENEQVIESFLARQADFALVTAHAALQPHLRPQGELRSEGGIPDSRMQDSRLIGTGAAVLFDARGYFRTWPHRHATDGFFAAVLERAGSNLRG